MSVVRCFDETRLKGRVKIVCIEGDTIDVVETVKIIIKATGITGPIYIKDADVFFKSIVPIGENACATVELDAGHSMSTLFLDVAGTSYVRTSYVP